MNKVKNKEESIKEILKASLFLFNKNGFSGTTTDEIAKKAKVSKGLIYFYFSSKEQILIKLIEDAFKEIEGLEPQLFEPLDIIQQFINGCKQSLRKPDKWKFIISVLFQSHQNTLVKKFLEEKYLHYIEFLREQFEKLGSKSPLEEAKAFLAIMDGLALQSLFAPKHLQGEGVLDFIYQEYLKKYKL